MDFRTALGSLLLLGVTATAQNGTPTPAAPLPGSPIPGIPAATPQQDPDRPQPTPAEQIAELGKEKERLEHEILYVRSRTENAKAMLTNKLTKRGNAQSFRSIDAGTSVVAAPKVIPPAARKFARVMTPEERNGQSSDTMVLVNGRPLRQAAFDQLKHYLGTVPSAGDEAMQDQRAMFELIRVEAVASAFEESEGEAQIAEAISQLQQGKSMAEVAKAFGVVPGSGPDGHFEVTHNSPFGLQFEAIAFGATPGQQSRPFHNTQGFVLMTVDKIEKGASPELDKAIGNAVQVPYAADQSLMQKSLMAISAGQMELVVRDADVLKMLPPMFLPPTDAPMLAPGMTDEAVQQLTRKMAQLQAEILRYKQSPEAGSEARIKDLEAQLAETERELMKAARVKQEIKQDAIPDDAHTPPVKKAPPAK